MYQTIVTIYTEDSDGFSHDYDYIVNTKSNPKDLDLFSWIMNDFVVPENESVESVKLVYFPEVLTFDF